MQAKLGCKESAAAKDRWGSGYVKDLAATGKPHLFKRSAVLCVSTFRGMIFMTGRLEASRAILGKNFPCSLLIEAT